MVLAGLGEWLGMGWLGNMGRVLSKGAGMGKLGGGDDKGAAVLGGF